MTIQRCSLQVSHLTEQLSNQMAKLRRRHLMKKASGGSGNSLSSGTPNRMLGVVELQETGLVKEDFACAAYDIPLVRGVLHFKYFSATLAPK